MADNTPAKHLEPYKWQPGQSPNPAGRPKGSRNKLAESFLADVLTEWETHGAVAVSDMREKNPGDFVKMVASLVPKEMTLNLNNEIEMSDDELRERIRTLADSLAPLIGGTGGAGEGAEAAAGAGKPSIIH
jgi:hypothetical protein